MSGIIISINKGAGAWQQPPPAWPDDTGGRLTMGTLRIPLTQGKFAVIDAEDLPLIASYSWHATRSKGGWYARSTLPRANGKRPCLQMHRVIAGAACGVEVDHWDGDGLNNRRLNLRRVTHHQNQQNKRGSKHNRSGFKGVSWHAPAGQWRARIKSNGKEMYLGIFDSAEDAARAYDAKARELFGSFARLNFPNDGEQSGRRAA